MACRRYESSGSQSRKRHSRADESDEVLMARALKIMQATLERRDKEIVRLTTHAEYARHGYAQNHPHEYHNSQGDLMTRTYLAWRCVANVKGERRGQTTPTRTSWYRT